MITPDFRALCVELLAWIINTKPFPFV